jgi:hypothetical protein
MTAVRDRLTGQRMALVIAGEWERREDLTAAREMLRAAGAEVISTTRVPVPFGPVPVAARTSLSTALSANGGEDGIEVAALDAIGAALAGGYGFSRVRQMAAPLGIELEGEYRLPARRVALLLAAAPAPSETAPSSPRLTGREEVAVTIARAAAAGGAAVVVGETESSPPIAELRGMSDRGISTVDNVDSAAGQLALVLTLAGSPGNWGVKAGSGRLLPLLEPPR